MRFCQTDGTPLVDAADDPLKTTVVRQEDILSSMPPSDPFKTMVATPPEKDESGEFRGEDEGGAHWWAPQWPRNTWSDPPARIV